MRLLKRHRLKKGATDSKAQRSRQCVGKLVVHTTCTTRRLPDSIGMHGTQLIPSTVPLFPALRNQWLLPNVAGQARRLNVQNSMPRCFILKNPHGLLSVGVGGITTLWDPTSSKIRFDRIVSLHLYLAAASLLEDLHLAALHRRFPRVQCFDDILLTSPF